MSTSQSSESAAGLRFVVPAHNEGTTLPRLLRSLTAQVTAETVFVVDNASSDDTASVAAQWDVNVVHEARIGKGYAIARGMEAADARTVFCCDADIEGLDVSDVFALAREYPDAPLARLALGRAPEASPVTTFTALPIFSALGLAAPLEPLGGLALVDTSLFRSLHLPGGWGFDVSLTMAALSKAGAIPERAVSGVSHRVKPLQDYRAMAEAVSRSMFIGAGIADWSHADCIVCVR